MWRKVTLADVNRDLAVAITGRLNILKLRSTAPDSETVLESLILGSGESMQSLNYSYY